MNLDTKQIRDLPQKTDPLSKRCDENGFSSVSIGKNGSLEPYKIKARPVESVIMKIYTDPLSQRYEEDESSSVCIGENGSLETYKIRPPPVKYVIMMRNAMEDNNDSTKPAIDSFNIKYFKEYSQNFHKWEEFSKGQKILRM